LRIEIELAERFEIAIEELQTEGGRGLDGIDVEDAAAPCELLAGVNLGNFLEAGGQEKNLQFLRVLEGANFKAKEGLGESPGGRRGVGEGIGGCDCNAGGAVRGTKMLEGGETLGVSFRVGKFDFEVFEGRVGEGDGGAFPSAEFLGEAFAMPSRAPEDPESTGGVSGRFRPTNESAEEGVGRGFDRSQNEGKIGGRSRHEGLQSTVVPGELQGIRR